MTTKICSKCKTEKEIIFFRNDKSEKDEIYSSCIDCKRRPLLDLKEKRKQYLAEYRSNNKDIISKKSKEYKEKNKDKLSKQRKEYYLKNKEKLLEQKKEYYLKNQEKIKEQKRLERKNSTSVQIEKERIRGRIRSAKRRQITGNHLSINTIRFLLEQYKYKCYYCNSSIKHKEKNSYHIDHYIPISKGGNNDTSNLVIACPSCNLSKGAKDPHIFMLKFGKLL